MRRSKRAGASKEGPSLNDFHVETFPDMGRGVVCDKTFQTGEKVLQYIGELISGEEALEREKRYGNHTQASYLYFLTFKGDWLCIDATVEDGTLGRLINHGDPGNLYPKLHDVEGMPQIWFHARRLIAKGEQLLYKYGETREEVIQANPWLKKPQKSSGRQRKHESKTTLKHNLLLNNVNPVHNPTTQEFIVASVSGPDANIEAEAMKQTVFSINGCESSSKADVQPTTLELIVASDVPGPDANIGPGPEAEGMKQTVFSINGCESSSKVDVQPITQELIVASVPGPDANIEAEGMKQTVFSISGCESSSKADGLHDKQEASKSGQDYDSKFRMDSFREWKILVGLDTSSESDSETEIFHTKKRKVSKCIDFSGPEAGQPAPEPAILSTIGKSQGAAGSRKRKLQTRNFGSSQPPEQIQPVLCSNESASSFLSKCSLSWNQSANGVLKMRKVTDVQGSVLSNEAEKSKPALPVWFNEVCSEATRLAKGESVEAHQKYNQILTSDSISKVCSAQAQVNGKSSGDSEVTSEAELEPLDLPSTVNGKSSGDSEVTSEAELEPLASTSVNSSDQEPVNGKSSGDSEVKSEAEHEPVASTSVNYSDQEPVNGKSSGDSEVTSEAEHEPVASTSVISSDQESVNGKSSGDLEVTSETEHEPVALTSVNSSDQEPVNGRNSSIFTLRTRKQYNFNERDSDDDYDFDGEFSEDDYEVDEESDEGEQDDSDEDEDEAEAEVLAEPEAAKAAKVAKVAKVATATVEPHAQREAEAPSEHETTSSTENPEFVEVASKRMGKRDYKKRFACLFCNKLVLKLPTHLLKEHEKEDDVQKLKKLKVKSKERQDFIASLRAKGNFIHNQNALKKQTGIIIPKSRSLLDIPLSDLVACMHCAEFYRKKWLYRHEKNCRMKFKSSGPAVSKTSRKPVVAVASFMIGSSCETTKKLFEEEILGTLRSDDEGNTVRGDKLLLMFGMDLTEGFAGQDQSSNIRNKLRELARLLIELKEKKIVNNLTEAFHPSKFYTVLEHTLKITGYDIAKNTFKTPSLAKRIGESLVKCATILKREAIIARGEEKKKEINEFLELHKIEWSKKVSAKASLDLKEKGYNKPTQLPDKEDVDKICTFITDQTASTFKALTADPTNAVHFQALNMVTLASAIVLNRKRPGDTHKLTISTYKEARVDKPHQVIYDSLSDKQKELVSSLYRVEARGKRKMKVPLLFTKQMTSSIRLLLKTRLNCGVPKENKYLFPNINTTTFVRGSDAIRYCREQAKCSHPERVTATCLRKEAATLGKVVGLSEEAVEELAEFLGHDLKTHKKKYRLPEATIQTAKVSQYLLKISNLPAGGSSGEASTEQAESELSEDEDDIIPESDSDASRKSNGKEKKTKQRVKVMKATRKKKRSDRKWNKWTPDEIEVVMEHLGADIEAGVVPGKDKCSIVIRRTPCKNRAWDQVKQFCRNEINRRLKNTKVLSSLGQ